MDLTTAIRILVANHDTLVNETAVPSEVVEEIRSEISHQEVDFWELQDDNLIQAYHTVIDAEDAEITQALA